MTLSRRDQICKYIDRTMRGIEIAPWHSPIAPKRMGYDVKTLDVLDVEALRKRCIEDPSCAHKVGDIEDVDFVAPASEIDRVIGEHGGLNTFDYIISSHNFEHLPNPVKFLRACGSVLKEGGYLSMAIPDKRRTFDAFRSLTTAADYLEWYFEDREKPTPYQVFDFSASFLKNVPMLKSQPLDRVAFSNSLEACFETLKASLESEPGYTDIHVSVLTPASFGVILLQLTRLGLVPLKLVEITETASFEFYVHLQNVGYANLSKYTVTDDDLIHLFRRLP